MIHLQVAIVAWFEADFVCGSHSVGIPIVLVLHCLSLLFQSLQQYKNTRDKLGKWGMWTIPLIYYDKYSIHTVLQL